MPSRGPLARFLLALGLVCAGLFAVAGGLALRGPGLVAVVVAGGVSAALAAGIAREAPGGGRGTAMEAAWQAAAWAVGVLLVVAGVAAVAGGVLAALVTGAAVLAALAVVLPRLHRRRSASNGANSAAAIREVRRPATPPPAGRPQRPAGGAARGLPPVAALPTSALGREWLRTTAALAARLQPAARESIVRRREETLDELERRDPAGFARWLAGGAAAGSDPARYVRDGGAGGGLRDDRAAGTDAA